MLAQITVDAPNHGARRRAAAISVPSEAAPTTKTMVRTTRGDGGLVGVVAIGP